MTHNQDAAQLRTLAQRVTDVDPAAARVLAGYLQELADERRQAFAVAGGCGVVMRWNPYTEQVDFDSMRAARPNE